MSRIIGIDLGTTNSSVAVIDQGGEPVLIPNAVGELLMPSAVRILANGEVVTGERAYRSRALDPKGTITGIKRFIGRRYNEIADIAEMVPFDVVLGKNNMAVIQVRGTQYTPQWISAMILEALKQSAEEYLKEDVRGAVITVPAYFNQAQRLATKEAAEIAGIEVYRIVIEPIAAALAYGLLKRTDQTVAVFDLGGGTFDISLVEVGEGVNEVKATEGDGFLGGDDFDAQIVNWMVEEFKMDHGLDIADDPLAIQRIRDEAIRAKTVLSQALEVTLTIPCLSRRNGIAIDLEMVLTRSKFEDLCAELFERLVKPCERVLRNANCKPEHIDRVICVGGATRMAKISGIVQRVFGKSGYKPISPQEAVGLGAAVQAGVLEGRVNDCLLLDVTAFGLGVETENGLFHLLIAKDTTIPTRTSEIFSTSQDNQTSVELHVLEGDGALSEENRTLGRLVLEGIPAAPRGIPQIEVTADIWADGRTNICAKDLGTGKEVKMIVKPEVS